MSLQFALQLDGESQKHLPFRLELEPPIVSEAGLPRPAPLKSRHTTLPQ